ncbi:hypothetical protein CDD82_7175 [Ophiocordyceps australis]|uniref:Major facilitator superfamily (MFS) profile domain-containing protein n=1 Tax=Ophiocordyceps australis TaxID=1399860 RepID=A0A2C5YLH4_9HYPO|nr:hypothetical protein CDD82_7175 [Ophiocordyceps australis]
MGSQGDADKRQQARCDGSKQKPGDGGERPDDARADSSGLQGSRPVESPPPPQPPPLALPPSLRASLSSTWSQDDDDLYPEGGAAAWLVVLGSWFAMLSAMGLMNTVGILQAYVVEHQLRGQDPGTVGWIFSVYTFLAFFCGVYIGPVFDKYGPRWLLVAGCALTCSGVFAMSFCHELYQFVLSFGILAGTGTSLLFTPCIAAVGHWFRRRRGFATGVASTAGGIGGIVFPLMLTSLFPRIGFAWATRALVLVCLLGGLLGIMLVRSRLAPAANATAHPDLRIFCQAPFALTTLAIFLLEFSLFIPLTFIATFALEQGFSQSFAFHLLPIMNAGSVVGRFLPGYYSDVFGPFNTCLFSILLSLVSCLCVWLPLGHTAPGIIIFAVLFGFASGNSIAIAPVCIGRMCKTRSYGRYYATAYTVVSFACLIGVPIGGSIIRASGGSYKPLIIVTGAIYVVSAMCMMLAKVWQLGWGGWLDAY